MLYFMLNFGRSAIRMFAWNVTDIPWSTCSRLCQKKMKSFFPTETPYHLWPFRWPVVGGDTFSPLAPILGPEKKVVMSPFSTTVREDQYDNKYLVCTRNVRIDGASGIRGGWEFRRLSWTSSYQRRDRNTRNRTRGYYNLLARIFRASFVLTIAYS